MSDKLKSFVDARREDFELFSLDVETGWQEIKEEVSVSAVGKPFMKPWMTIAASISLVLIGALIGYRMYSTDMLAGESSEFIDMQFYYEEMVDTKLQLVRQRVDDPVILEDLEAMDQAFAELKADLRDNVDNEEVLEAMIDNYRLKLQILQRILDELEEESHEEQTHL